LVAATRWGDRGASAWIESALDVLRQSGRSPDSSQHSVVDSSRDGQSPATDRKLSKAIHAFIQGFVILNNDLDLKLGPITRSLLVKDAKTKEELAHGVLESQNERLDISVMDDRP
jgi:hypothetical protein